MKVLKDTSPTAKEEPSEWKKCMPRNRKRELRTDDFFRASCRHLSITVDCSDESEQHLYLNPTLKLLPKQYFLGTQVSLNLTGHKEGPELAQ